MTSLSSIGQSIELLCNEQGLDRDMVIEAMKDADGMSAVQLAMVNHCASQCGFCTPGFVMAITALFIGMFADGMVSAYAFISVGLFCSTLWPCIFTLAIAGLGKHTNEGASFLIMMIMGGGVISLTQGFLADNSLLGIQWSYLIGVACFAYLAFYAVRVMGILKSQGIDYDRLESSGGH